MSLQPGLRHQERSIGRLLSGLAGRREPVLLIATDDLPDGSALLQAGVQSLGRLEAFDGERLNAAIAAASGQGDLQLLPSRERRLPTHRRARSGPGGGLVPQPRPDHAAGTGSPLPPLPSPCCSLSSCCTDSATNNSCTGNRCHCSPWRGNHGSSSGPAPSAIG